MPKYSSLHARIDIQVDTNSLIPAPRKSDNVTCLKKQMIAPANSNEYSTTERPRIN